MHPARKLAVTLYWSCGGWCLSLTGLWAGWEGHDRLRAAAFAGAVWCLVKVCGHCR